MFGLALLWAATRVLCRSWPALRRLAQAAPQRCTLERAVSARAVLSRLWVEMAKQVQAAASASLLDMVRMVPRSTLRVLWAQSMVVM